MIHTLLICGSRALSNTLGEAWARRVLTARIGELPPGGVLLHGGCPDSPDAWADEIGAARGDITVRALHADGHSEVTTHGNTLRGQWRREVREASLWVHFRERNLALIAETIRYQEIGNRAVCICLAASASKTRGGPWTAEQARVAGIESHVFWWS
jgi:hypothetical protein